MVTNNPLLTSTMWKIKINPPKSCGYVDSHLRVNIMFSRPLPSRLNFDNSPSLDLRTQKYNHYLICYPNPQFILIFTHITVIY